VADGSVTLVVKGATVQMTSERAEGVLATPTTTVQVVISVPADEAPGVLGAIAGRPLVVVVHESVDSAGDSSSRSAQSGKRQGGVAGGAGASTGTATPTGSSSGTATPTGGSTGTATPTGGSTGTATPTGPTG
jgi:hypothetical protein